MATTHLTRTFGAGNQKIFTFSGWFKRTGLGEQHIFGQREDDSNRTHIFLNADDNLFFYSNNSAGDNVRIETNKVFKDISGYYNFVIAVDTNQSTAADRVKMYVNGVQETSFSQSTYPVENGTLVINNAVQHNIGSWNTTHHFFNGIMSHVHFCDGTQLEPTVFGSTDATTGEWKINTSPSFTLGTNGFTILKDGSTITDQSSNSNNWTLGGGTLTNTEDCPSDVFCTMNPLATSSYSTLTNGNTTSGGNTNSDNGNSFGTLVPNKGKFYCEVKVTKEGTGYPSVGLAQASDANFGNCKNSSAGMAGYNTANSSTIRPDGQRVQNNSTSSWTSTTFDTNDVLMLAMDCDNGACYIGKNGTWMESGDPTSGGTKTGAFQTWTPASHTEGQTFAIRDYDISVAKWNFGNGYFGTTAISSEGTNASNIGKFEYDVPTGFTALSTKGLNE